MKTLGEAGQDVDDLAAWVTRSKKAEKKAKDLERLKAERLAKQLEEQVSLFQLPTLMHYPVRHGQWVFWIWSTAFAYSWPNLRLKLISQAGVHKNSQSSSECLHFFQKASQKKVL